MGKVTSIAKSQLVDTKQEIIDKVGDVSKIEISSHELLVAIYMRPEMTTGGIVLPHQNLREDLYQAKAHLVLKIGSECVFPNGLDVKLHDWIVFRPSDAWAIDVNANPDALRRDDFVPCRFVYDDRVRAIVAHPGMVW